jgi:hypothetical protein
MATGLAGIFSPLPGLRSLNELVNDILLFVGLPDDTDAQAAGAKAVKAGIRQLNTRRWRWSQTYDDLTMVASQFDYSLPRDVNQPMHVERLNSSSNPDGRLWYKNPKTFLLEHSRATGDGQPTVYTITDYQASGVLSLDLAPNASFVSQYPTLRFWYMRNVRFPEGGESINVPSAVEHFVESYGGWYMAARHARDRVDDAERDWRLLWQELVMMDNQETDWAE